MFCVNFAKFYVNLIVKGNPVRTHGKVKNAFGDDSPSYILVFS